MAKRTDPEQEIARLYALPLDEFVAERDAAAKHAREGGDADAAKRIKALRKPSVPAAAINRATAADRKATAGLIEAGERLEAAQAKALAGGDADALREAAAEHGEAVERLMDTVTKELAGAGGSAAVDRARETLRAVAADPELRAEVGEGRLIKDREGVGFGASAGDVNVAAAAKPKRKPKAKAKGPTATERKRAQQAVNRAERAVGAAAKRLKQAERRLERARRGVAEAEDEVADAERERSARESELAEARAARPG